MKKLCLFYAVLLLCMYQRAYSQNTFSQRMDFGSAGVVCTSIEPVSDSTYLVSVILTDTLPPYLAANLTVLFDEQGNIHHQSLLRDTEVNIEAWAKDKRVGDMVLKTGYTTIGSMKGLLLAYDLEGELLWQVQQPNFFDSTFFFRYNDVLVYNDSIYVIGHLSGYEDDLFRTELVLAIYSLNGELLDYRSYNSPNWRENALSIKMNASNQIILGATIDNLHQNLNDFKYRCKIWALDTLSNVQWTWESPASELQQGVQDMVLTDDGGIVIASGIGTEIPIHSSESDIYWDCYVYKLNADRQKEWGTYLRHGPPSSVNSLNKIISLTNNSGYVVTGTAIAVYSDGNINEENTGDWGGLIAKISPQGDSLWSRVIIHPDLPSYIEKHYLFDITETSDGGFLAVGSSSHSETTPSQQGWLLKLDEWGCLVPGCHLVSNTTAVAAQEMTVLLHPNPVQNLLNVYLGPSDLPSGSHFRVLDMQGQVLLERMVSQADATYLLPVHNLSAGAYILQFCDQVGAPLAVKQFVVQ